MVQYEVVWQAAITELNTVVEEDVFVVALAVDCMVMVAADILLAKGTAPLSAAAHTQVLEARRHYHQCYYHRRCCSFHHELHPMMPTPIMVVIMVALLAWHFCTHFAHKH